MSGENVSEEGRSMIDLVCGVCGSKNWRNPVASVDKRWPLVRCMDHNDRGRRSPLISARAFAKRQRVPRTPPPKTCSDRSRTTNALPSPSPSGSGDSMTIPTTPPSLPPGLTVTGAVRDGLRIIMQIGPACPTCGRSGATMSLREVGTLTGVSAATLSRFVRGAPLSSDILDRLYEWVNARLPEKPK